MAFELAEIDPDSVPINLLNPRTGTKFGDRELMDPWEVVKWVAIFRLILPDALFRLCGGRVENLQELQPLAVKAGLNGVMMGNFLTTLGVEPAEDREMFEELGLNVARQPDNGANPRPDNRSGWLEGETPPTPIDELIDSQADANFWDPSTQLRVVKKKGKPPAYPQRPSDDRDASPGRLGRLVLEISERLAELESSGLRRRLRVVEGPQGPRGGARRRGRCCCSARTTTSGWPTIRACAARPPTPRSALGTSAGASRLISGSMSIHAELEARLAEFKGTEAALLFGSGYLANSGVDRRARAARRGRLLGRAQPRQHHRRLPAGRRRDLRLPPRRHRAPRVGPAARRRGRAALIVTDGVFSMDGDIAPLPELAELARRHRCRLLVDEAHATGCIGPGGRGSVAAAGLTGEVDVIVGTLGKALGGYGAYVCGSAELVDFLINSARPFIFSTAPASSGRRRGSGGARAARRAAASGWSASVPTRPPSAKGCARRGSSRSARTPRSCRWSSARPTTRWRSASACSQRASSRRRSGRRPSRRAPAACA